MTPMWSRSPTLSTVSRVVSDRPSNSRPIPIDAHAPEVYGSRPRADAAPRNRNSVQKTLKIMNRISQAPPLCEP